MLSEAMERIHAAEEAASRNMAQVERDARERERRAHREGRDAVSRVRERLHREERERTAELEERLRRVEAERQSETAVQCRELEARGKKNMAAAVGVITREAAQCQS